MTRRRSKVRSKTRSDSSQKSEDEILYCICRSSDGTRFMIACDNCEEWYHGDCINVTPKQANNIKRFFCHLCIGRNPSLEIEYKTSKENRPRLPNLRQQIKKINFSSDEENDADLSSSSSPDKSLASNKSKRANRKRWRPSISESVGKKRRGRPKERQDDYDDEATEDEIETGGFNHSISECVDDGIEATYISQDYRSIGHTGRVISRRSSIGRSQLQNKSTSRSFISNSYLKDLNKTCGVCEPCKRTADCGQCDICRRYGSSPHPKNICRKRCCVRIDYRNPSRKAYNVSKEYGTLIDEDLDGVLDEQDYQNQQIRRRGDFSLGEVRQRLSNPPPSNNKDTCAIGSKMRRGDHLPGGGNSSSHRRSLTNATSVPYKCQGQDSLELMNGTSFRYSQPAPNNRLSKNQPSQPPARRVRNQSNTAAQMSSNTSSVSGGQMSQQYQYADESEEDVMIPGELISHSNGQRLDETDVRHYSNYQHQRSVKTYSNNDKKHHYGLTYPDHLYCKHHRSYDWHGNNNTGDLSSSSEVVLSGVGSGTLRQESSATMKGPDKDMDMVHSRLRSPSLERPLSPGTFMVLDRVSSKVSGNRLAASSASSSSMSAETRYAKMHPKTVLSLPPQTCASSSSSLVMDRHEPGITSSGDTFVHLYGESGQSYPHQSHHLHSQSHHTSQHHQSPLVDLGHPATASDKSSSCSQLLPAGTSTTSIIISSNNNNSSSISNNNNNISGKDQLPHSISVFMKSSSSPANNQQQAQPLQQQLQCAPPSQNQEFYTINDEDDLEINWPKETVNA